MRERDLFDIFPDLPRAKRGTAEERVEAVRVRARQVGLAMQANAARQRAKAQQQLEAWERRRGARG